MKEGNAAHEIGHSDGSIDGGDVTDAERDGKCSTTDGTGKGDCKGIVCTMGIKC